MKDTPTKREILEKAADIVDGERQKDYGSPEQAFKRIANLWGAYLGRELTAKDVSILMMLLKIARLMQNSEHADSWVDIAGYAACGGSIS